MNTRIGIKACLVLAVALAGGLSGFGETRLQAQEKSKPPLKEAEVQKMLDLQLDDAVIVDAIRKRGLADVVDEAYLKRIKGLGASASVLKELQERGKPAAGVDEDLMVWVTRNSEYSDASLFSEMYINDRLVEAFTSDTRVPVKQFLRPGQNTILLKTKPNLRAKKANELQFTIGPVSKNDEGELVMRPLWLFDNGTDWSINNGKPLHAFGPDVKEVAIAFPLHYGGTKEFDSELTEGAFVLQASPNSAYHNTSVTATVWVNGTPLTSFANQDHQVTITPLLKAGRNEIKLVSHRVENCAYDNPIHLSLSGFAKYNRQHQKYELVPLLQLEADEGWERDKRNLKLYSRLDRKAAAIERVIPFHLDADPNAGAVSFDPSDEPVLMLYCERDSEYHEASLHTELSINGELVDVFTSNTRRPIGHLLKPGANRVSVRTFPQRTASRQNELTFRMGLVSRDKNDELRMRTIWSFDNGTDWQYEDGKHTHALGLDVADVSLEIPLNHAGGDPLPVEVKKGDYVLQAAPDSEYHTTCVIADVVINGTPLDTLTQASQQVVITSLLKPGKNDVTFTSYRVANVARDNGLTVKIGGPAEFDLASQTFTFKPIVEWHAIEGWKRNEKTLQLEGKDDPGIEKVEHRVTITVDG